MAPRSASRADVPVPHPDRVYSDAMAKTVQIRKVPDEIHRTLRTRATAAGMSLSDYLLAEIVRLADRPSIADVLTRARARTGGASREDIVDVIRSGRDEGD